MARNKIVNDDTGGEKKSLPLSNPAIGLPAENGASPERGKAQAEAIAEKTKQQDAALLERRNGVAAKVVTIEEVKRDPMVKAFIRRANEQLKLIGYTEHGERHASLVSHISHNILERLGKPQRMADLAEIAAYLHDIGNVVHRENHAQSGALIAFDILQRLGMDPVELALVMGAIGNHEEERGDPVSEMCAALIIADKADVHRSRVQNPDPAQYDIHDRVNYAATRSFVTVSDDPRRISIELEIDTSSATIMEYFEIFLSRMVIARKSAQFLDAQFELVINGVRLQ